MLYSSIFNHLNVKTKRLANNNRYLLVEYRRYFYIKKLAFYIGVTLNREPTQLENAIASMPHKVIRKLPLSMEVRAK